MSTALVCPFLDIFYMYICIAFQDHSLEVCTASVCTQSKDFRVQSAPCSPVVCVHTFFLLFHMKSDVGILVYPSFS